MKNTKIKIKCVGGGGTNLLYLLCPIPNTMPQLEQSSLQPSTYLQHRHLLQTTSYNHLLLLHLLISRKGKPKQQQARTPPPPLDGGLRSQKGLRPFKPTTEDRAKEFKFQFTRLKKLLWNCGPGFTLISFDSMWKIGSHKGIFLVNERHWIWNTTMHNVEVIGVAAIE